MSRKYRVLVVDDWEFNIEVLRFHLDESRFEVIPSTNALEAIEVARSTMPDIILLDIMMPGVDGFELCKALKGDDLLRDIPVVFVTVKSDPESLLKGLEIGAVDFITRPFVPEDLKQRLLLHFVESLDGESMLRMAMERTGLEFARGARRRMSENRITTAGTLTYTPSTVPSEHVGGDLSWFTPVGPYHAGMCFVSVGGIGIGSTLLTASIHALMSPEPDQGLLCRLRHGSLVFRDPIKLLDVVEQAFPEERTERNIAIAYLLVDLRTGEYRHASRGVGIIGFDSDSAAHRLAGLGDELEEGSGRLIKEHGVVMVGPGLMESAPEGGPPFGLGAVEDVVSRASLAAGDHPEKGIVDAIIEEVNSQLAGVPPAADLAASAIFRASPRVTTTR